nr:uncharacterized protein LOC127296380 [Lolium perenne]
MPLGAASKPTRGVGRLLDPLAGELSRWGRLVTMGSGEPRLNKRGHALDRAKTSVDLPHLGRRGGGRDGRDQASSSRPDLWWGLQDGAFADDPLKICSDVVVSLFLAGRGGGGRWSSCCVAANRGAGVVAVSLAAFSCSSSSWTAVEARERKWAARGSFVHDDILGRNWSFRSPWRFPSDRRWSSSLSLARGLAPPSLAVMPAVASSSSVGGSSSVFTRPHKPSPDQVVSSPVQATVVVFGDCSTPARCKVLLVVVHPPPMK